jgi:hypothetical protein
MPIAIIQDNFANRLQFRRWLITVAYREALRLLPGHRLVERWFYQLPDDQRCVLQWLYIDQLTYRQLAETLRNTPAEARNQGRTAYQAFRQILLRANRGTDDWTFPPYPADTGL